MSEVSENKEVRMANRESRIVQHESIRNTGCKQQPVFSSGFLPAPRSLLVALTALLFALSFFIVLLFPPCSVLHAPCSSAWAQQPKKVPRIGYESGVSSIEREEAF